MLSLIVIIIARLPLLAVISHRSQKGHAVVTTPRLPAPPIGSRVTFQKRICAEGRTLPSAPAKGEPVLVKRLVDLQERCSGHFGYMAVAHLAFSLCLLLVLSGQNFFAPHPPVTLSRKPFIQSRSTRRSHWELGSVFVPVHTTNPVLSSTLLFPSSSWHSYTVTSRPPVES
jgi:hypothetical protein